MPYRTGDGTHFPFPVFYYHPEDTMTQDTIVYLKNAGKMDKRLIHVEDNVYDIPRRIRQEVSPDFIVMFNPRTQRFEIHRIDGRYSLELTIPYDQLDSRAIEYALYSRDVERVRTEIEENNARLDEAKRKAKDHENSCKARDLFTYCNRHTDKETWDDEAYKTREV